MKIRNLNRFLSLGISSTMILNSLSMGALALEGVDNTSSVIETTPDEIDIELVEEMPMEENSIEEADWMLESFLEGDLEEQLIPEFIEAARVEKEVIKPEDILDEDALMQMIITTKNKPTTYSSSTQWYTVEGVEGGQLQFDKSSGAIVGSENTITQANIPDTIDGVAVKSIGVQAFCHIEGTSLEFVSIPKAVTTIEMMAFAFCNNEEGSIEFRGDSELTEIGALAFYSVKMEYALPDNEFNLGDYALAASNLADRDSLKISSLGKQALFRINIPSCEITLNDIVTIIPQGAFVLSSFKSLSSDGVQEIESQAFSGAKFEKLEMRGSIKALGESVFAYAETEILSLENLEEVPALLFAYCQVESVTLSGVVDIKEQAFNGAQIDSVEILMQEDLEYAVAGSQSFQGAEIRVLDYKNVAVIDEYAFWGYIGETVILNGSSYEGSIGKQAFQEANIDNLILGNPTSIDEKAFYMYTGETIEGMNGVASMGNYAFEESVIEKISEFSSLEKIGSYTFRK